jgi:hypothetical protein
MIDWVHSLWLIVFNATFNHILWCSNFYLICMWYSFWQFLFIYYLLFLFDLICVKYLQILYLDRTTLTAWTRYKFEFNCRLKYNPWHRDMIDWVHSLWLIVFNATFNHILWCSVLLVAETRVPGENHSRLAVYYFLEIIYK